MPRIPRTPVLTIDQTGRIVREASAVPRAGIWLAALYLGAGCATQCMLYGLGGGTSLLLWASAHVLLWWAFLAYHAAAAAMSLPDNAIIAIGIVLTLAFGHWLVLHGDR